MPTLFLNRLFTLLGLSLLLAACGGSNTDNNDVIEASAASKGVVDVAVSYSQTCVQRNDGSAVCWGSNEAGQLGFPLPPVNIGDEAGEMGAALEAVNLGEGLIPQQISARGGSTCVLFNNGGVTCFGHNWSGQLGQGHQNRIGNENKRDMGDKLAYVDLGVGAHVIALSSGGSFHCALLRSGLVKCWGSNSWGQLGQGDRDGRGDEPNEMGDALFAIDLGEGLTATAIASGRNHSCAILHNNAVKCWGYNAFGELGQGKSGAQGVTAGQMGNALAEVDLGTNLTVIALALGNHHSCALFEVGTVKCWGRNREGQLGQGDDIKRGGQLEEMGDALAFIDLGTGLTAVAIAAKEDQTCALLSDGSVKCWGENLRGSLGLGDSNNRGDEPNEMGDHLARINLGDGHTAQAISGGCARLGDDSLKCWGDNEFGQLGQGDTEVRGDGVVDMATLAAIELGSDRTVLSIAEGRSHTCALLNTDQVACWGLGAYLGLGKGFLIRGDNEGEMGSALPYLDLGADIEQLSVGGNFICARLSAGVVKCWGDNDVGQLGRGNAVTRTNYPGELYELTPIELDPTHKVVKVASSDGHSCVLLDKGLVKCWGSNDYGQLGLGHSENWGDNVEEMGSFLSSIDFGLELAVEDIAVGPEHNCALFEGGRVKCWGNGWDGALGLGATDNRGDELGEMGMNLPLIDLGEGSADAISVGYLFSCVLLTNGQVKCWGNNTHGQLGQGHANDIYDVGDALFSIELGAERTATQLANGDDHSCALLDNSTVKCWGNNDLGQLGLGDTEHRGDDPGEMGDDLPTVDLGRGRTAIAIAAGGYGTCAILDDTTLKCWGENYLGSLGQGDPNHRGDEPSEMGDHLKPIVLQ